MSRIHGGKTCFAMLQTLLAVTYTRKDSTSYTIKEHHYHSCLNAGAIVLTAQISWQYVNNSCPMKNLWAAFLLVVVRMSRTIFWYSTTSCHFSWSLLYWRKKLNWHWVVECTLNDCNMKGNFIYQTYIQNGKIF